MKVAILHDFLVKQGGAERVVKVLSEMYPDAPIYTLFYLPEKMDNYIDPKRIKTPCFNWLPHFFKKRYRLFFPFLQNAVSSIDFSDYDLVISSSGAYSLGAITGPDTIHICYCHSPIRYLWDYKDHYLDEQNFGFFMKLIINFIFTHMRMYDKEASLRPDVFISNSNNVKRRIKKYYRRESTIIYPPVDVSRFTVTEEHDGYFLIVSTLTPYKKNEQAIKLFNKCDKRLVIIGDGVNRAYLENISNDNIDFLGFKDDATVTTYMENCRALVFPGEDDFGITPLEAMACGKPVLAYGRGGALETVIPGKTGELFYSHDLIAMENALGQLLFNEHQYSAEDIATHSEQFSKKHFVKKMEIVLNSIKI